MEEKSRRLFSSFANWNMWKMAKILRPFAVFAQFPNFFAGTKSPIKSQKNKIKTQRGTTFCCLIRRNWLWKIQLRWFLYFPRSFTEKKTTFLGGIISKFLLISNFLQSLSGSQNVCVQSVKMWSHFCEKVAHKSISKTAAPSFDDHDHIHCCYVFVNNCGSGIVLNWNPSVFYDHVIFVYIFWQPGTFWRRTTSRFIKKWNWTTAVVDATWYSRTPLGTGLRSTGLKIHLGKISTKLPSHWLVGTFTNNQKCKLSIMQNNILVPFIA